MKPKPHVNQYTLLIHACDEAKRSISALRSVLARHASVPREDLTYEASGEIDDAWQAAKGAAGRVVSAALLTKIHFDITAVSTLIVISSPEAIDRKSMTAAEITLDALARAAVVLGVEAERQPAPVIFKTQACWDVLCALDKARCSLSDDVIADRTQHSKHTVRDVLSVLVEGGYVEPSKPGHLITALGISVVSDWRKNLASTEIAPFRN